MHGPCACVASSCSCQSTHHRPPRRARRAHSRPHERNHTNHDRLPTRQHRREATAAAGLAPLLVELLRIRTSQINGCAFCLRMHTRDALKKGENPDRIAVLPGWEETGYFSETDRSLSA